MSPCLRLVAGLFVVFCVMQLAQMASVEREIERFRRDSPPEETKGDSIFKQAEDQINKYLNDEKTKEFLKSAANAFGEFTQGMETKFKEFKDKLASGNEQKN